MKMVLVTLPLILAFTSLAATDEGKYIAGDFRLYDATVKKEITLPDGTRTRVGDKTIFDCKGSDIRLHAEFVPQGELMLVRGELENLRADERGFILDYRLPPLSGEALFANGLNESVRMAGAAECEGNVFPIATMSDNQRGVAMAIPPTEPRDFGMVGSAKGLTIRFYLGLSPLTKQFPNRASFTFVIYAVDPKWGFRSALNTYYGLYPDYYDRRVQRYGEDLIRTRDGRDPPDIEHYAFTRINFNQAETEFARNKKSGILSHGYLNPGVVELTKLTEKPRNLEEATAVYKKLCESTAEEWTEGGGDPGPSELIRNSACTLSNGKPAMFVRYTPGGKNSIAFKSNPNPDLFGDKKVAIGKKALWTAEGWLAKYPQLDAVMIDSLGANWPAQLNYREDHFVYAHYPLTCDSQGRPALHNQFSYYELLDALRTRLRAKGKFLFGNGIYNYPSNQTLEPEHYRGRGVVLGRFFLAALLDAATSESGVRADQSRLEFCRVALCRKPYVLTNSDWKDVQAMAAWFNKTLVYNICGSNVRIYSTTEPVKPYYPEGYARDKELIHWYMPLQERLWKAGWEPVTRAKASAEKVLIERYGGGDTLYFAVMSELDKEQPCAITIDLEGLGLQTDKLVVEEIAHKTSVKVQGEGTKSCVQLNLRPNETLILELSRST